ncbi:heterodisulfide reductase-related iron-sulfur binding cluster [Nocardia sp. CNY236]|uniref:heterodisulfide reductase-related iron-sulfur binding cluster n=1 Tax=Nocardia sp. CNY236 TaxID=1169152 RepID=UPI0003FB12F0|nr:heterodisulfide reductase-related iron-sulfur binding cluster [Nocardia sp. CNY236]
MNALTVTLGTFGAALSLLCWASFFGGVNRVVRTIMVGQPAPDRLRPFFPRFKQMLIEFVAHTRMVKFRTVGWAHWIFMVGFMGGFILWFEAYGQTFDPEFHWPIIGDTAIYHLWDEILGIGTVVGIITLITIRQLNHPRVPERLSRFSGSNFAAAYFIESVGLIEGLGMIFVKAGKIATYGHANPATDFFTMRVATLLPASPTMVSIFAFIKLMSGMAFLWYLGRNVTWGVITHRFSAFPNIYFKREDDGSVALGAAKPMMSGGKPIDMETADPDVDTFGAGRVEDFSWKGWLDFTTCTECGRCQSQCPAWNTGKPLSPKLLIMSLRDHGYAKAPYLLAGGRKDAGGDEVGLVDAQGAVNESALAKIPEAARAEAERPLVGDMDVSGIIDPEVLWSCTTCGACVEQCPVDIEHVDHIIDMRRYQVLIESEFPSELAGLFKNLENKGNPWGQNAKDRLNWINELNFEIPVFGQPAANGEEISSFDGYDYLFWVGCAGAYEDRAKKTTKAVAELLATAGVKFMVLGAEETCTGDSARRAGNEFLFQQLAQQNIELLNSVFEGVEDRRKKIVVTCAHCFNALNNEYPQVGGSYEVVHHTQLLNRLVRRKQLIPVTSVSRNVTYHDPCYLGRHNKVYNAPRELMAASGSNLVEMPRHGERAMCCGAGGARMWMEEQLGKRINVDRVDEGLNTLAGSSNGSGTPGKIATGCPFCRVMLTDGVTARQENGEGEGVEVVDVAQLMLDAIERVDPAELTEKITVVQQPKAPAAKPEPEPELAPASATPTPATTAPAGGGLAMKGPAKAPGGLGMKGAAKAPGAKTPGGLGMKGGAKAPGAKAPGAQATEPTQTDATSAPAAPVKGLAMKGPAKAPGGLGMKGGAKAPGAKAPGAKAPGLAMKGAAKAPGAKAPGAKAPATDAPTAGPSGEATPDADSAAVAQTETAPTETKPTETKPTVPAKGLAMKSGFKRPGPKAPGAPVSTRRQEPETAATQTEPAVESEPTGNGASGDGAPDVAPPTAKPGGLGFKSGAKAPGRKN